MAVVEDFPALTKSEPISFGTLCPRKARAASPFALDGDRNHLRSDSLLASNTKKKRLRKQHKILSVSQDDCHHVHPADELVHAFIAATDITLRNAQDAQFGSVASIWRQHNPAQHSVPRADDEGFVDGILEPSFTASTRDDLEYSADVPQLTTGLGDHCHTSPTTALRTSDPPCKLPTPVNHFGLSNGVPRSRQGSSSENSVVFGSPDLPRLWDSSGQETAKHVTNLSEEIDLKVSNSTRTNPSSVRSSRNLRLAVSQERAGTGAVGDIDEDDLEGTDLLHLISNSLDRFNEIVHPHELNAGFGVNDDGVMLSADSTDLCSSGYGSFDQQPQQLLPHSEKFSLGEGKTAVEEAPSTTWLSSSCMSRLNQSSSTEPQRPYFLAGDCVSSLKDTTCAPTLCTNGELSNSGPGSGKMISPTVFPNGGSSLYSDHQLAGNVVGMVSSDSTMVLGDSTSAANSGCAPMLRHFCPGVPALNRSGSCKTNETLTEIASYPDAKASEWCEIFACAVRALQEGANRSTQSKEAILAAVDHGELAKNGINVDAILNSMSMLGLNETVTTTAQWSQETKPLTNTAHASKDLSQLPPGGMSSNHTTQGTPVSTPQVINQDNFATFNCTPRSTDVEQFCNQQTQSNTTAPGICGRRSVLSACFPSSSVNGSGAWDTSNIDVRLSTGTNGCTGPGCLVDHRTGAPFFDAFSQSPVDRNASMNATPFVPSHQQSRGQHRATRRANAPPHPGSVCHPGLLTPQNSSTGAGLSEPTLSYLLPKSNQATTAPVPLTSPTAFNTSRHNTPTPFLLDSKSSARPIVFHLQEFLRYGNTGNQKRMQYDRSADFPAMRLSTQQQQQSGGTSARSTNSSPPNASGAKASSAGNSSSNSSNNSTCGSTNPEQQSVNSTEVGGKPVIAKWRRACSFYLRGHCKKEDCEFAHDLTKVTCKFWEMGECFKGPTCPFLHGYPPELMSQEQQ
ncbi:hypothetical protein T265_03657 [Opisthorchis viverrini]|uniref:C3H1-type domain-containing protein n=1 Tax=Opisthorchis viverrini TaxID=6198 RepID=A0A075A2I7_OPIVI|nr:hypothetical protein T265_03657 [Opisthorchis viverrini]KER29745.1 hypothetical protein T265_03657 [Opisthorchis viverrini]